MKTARTLMASLGSAHAFRPLSRHRCYRAYLELLPPRFRRAIAFVTVKNRRLMVALSHPGYKMELNYNQELLKSLLSTLMQHRKECRFMEADSVVIFVSKYHTQEAEPSESTVPRYRELAEGCFELKTQDPELLATLERIRQAIRQNRESQNS